MTDMDSDFNIISGRDNFSSWTEKGCIQVVEQQ